MEALQPKLAEQRARAGKFGKDLGQALQSGKQGQLYAAEESSFKPESKAAPAAAAAAADGKDEYALPEEYKKHAHPALQAEVSRKGTREHPFVASACSAISLGAVRVVAGVMQRW